MPGDGKGREKRRRSESSAPRAAAAVRPKGASGAPAAKSPKRGKSPDPKRSTSAGKAAKPRAKLADGKAAGKAKKAAAGKSSPAAKDKKRKAAAAAAMSAVEDMFEGLAEKKQEKKDAEEKAKVSSGHSGLSSCWRARLLATAPERGLRTAFRQPFFRLNPCGIALPLRRGFPAVLARLACGFAQCLAPQAYEAAVARLADAREKKLDELEAAARRSNRVRGEDSPEPLRYDEELGMPIYSLEALNIGKGKDTAQCPFDCDCCF